MVRCSSFVSRCAFKKPIMSLSTPGSSHGENVKTRGNRASWGCPAEIRGNNWNDDLPFFQRVTQLILHHLTSHYRSDRQYTVGVIDRPPHGLDPGRSCTVAMMGRTSRCHAPPRESVTAMPVPSRKRRDYSLEILERHLYYKSNRDRDRQAGVAALSSVLLIRFPTGRSLLRRTEQGLSG